MEEHIEPGLLDRLVDLDEELTPENTFGRLSNSEQEAIAELFHDVAQGIESQGLTAENIARVMTWSFCLGHEYAIRYGSLWKRKVSTR